MTEVIDRQLPLLGNDSSGREVLVLVLTAAGDTALPTQKENTRR